MTSKYSHPTGEAFAVTISCDHAECDLSVDDKEIKAGGGLKEMNWQAVCIEGKMRHYCPDHHRNI